MEAQSMPTKSEKDLYPLVAGWVRRHFVCFKTEINKGLRYSMVDVIGVRDVGGELSGEVETIAIEVKREGSPFATTSGQTLGYNVYANRVYLAEARKGPFSPDEMDIASHLGIGLIQIRDKRCIEVLSSPFYTPIRRFNLRLLETLGLGRCQLCGSFFDTGNTKNPWAHMVRGEEPSEVVLKAINEEKGLMFWNMQLAERKRKLGLTKIEKGESKERSFICPECAIAIFAIDPDRIKAWIRDYGRPD
jgi:hypothetical protein